MWLVLVRNNKTDIFQLRLSPADGGWGPRLAAGGHSVRGIEDEALLHLVAGGVEVVVQVPGGGHHQLAGTHGAHLVIGQGVDIQRVPEGVELDQLLDNSLRKM